MICTKAAIAREREDREPLAAKSTLQRAETPGNERYHRIRVDEHAVSDIFVDVYLDSLKEPPAEIILDLDATDDRLHGNQEGRFFHGYYDCYCYLPLYIFAGDALLCAKLRRSNIDASAGALEELKRIVARIRKQMNKAKRRWSEGEASSRVYRQFRYRTLTSWSRARRVIAKAEYLGDKENPRFVVTNLGPEHGSPQQLCESGYCPRGSKRKPHQGAAAVFVRRPHLLGDHAGEPATAVVVGRGVCADEHPASCSTNGNGACPRAVPHNSAQALESGRTGSPYRPTRCGKYCKRLSLSRGVHSCRCRTHRRIAQPGAVSNNTDNSRKAYGCGNSTPFCRFKGSGWCSYRQHSHIPKRYCSRLHLPRRVATPLPDSITPSARSNSHAVRKGA